MPLAAAEYTFADREGLEFGCDQHAVDRLSSSLGQHLLRRLSTTTTTLDHQTTSGVTEHDTQCFTSPLAS